MAVAKLKSSLLYCALDSTCQHTEDPSPVLDDDQVNGYREITIIPSSLALVSPAKEPEGFCDGTPELSAAIRWFPASEDPVPATEWPQGSNMCPITLWLCLCIKEQ